MTRHGLIDRPARTAAEAAALICGLQAQDFAAARLAVRARAASVSDAEVRRAVDVDRSVVRTWLHRNTIHLVPSEDVRWLTALLGPMIRRRFETKRWPGLGLTPAVLAQVTERAPKVLEDGPLTRQEFAAALGMDAVATGQAPVHALLHLSTLGIVCHADANRFALVTQWLPDAPPGPRGDAALAELARRYFHAFSPAAGADFTAWCGLPSRHAIDLVRDELTETDGRFSLGEVREQPGIRLLGGFDNYLLGHRDRAHVIAAEHRDEVYIGGVIRPTIVHDGRVIGRWRLVRPSRKNQPHVVQVRWFGRPSPGVRADVDAEVIDIGRFMEVEAVPGQLRE